MSTSLGCMLSVNERVILFSILVSMGKCDLNIFANDVYNGIKTICSHCICKKICKSITTHYASSIIHYGKSCIEIGIVSQHCFNDIVVKTIIKKQLIIGFKEYKSSVFVCSLSSFIALKNTSFEYSCAHFSISIRTNFKAFAKRIDRFYTDSVQTYTLFKGL